MSAKKDRENSIRGWHIPNCGQWIWITAPNPDDAGDRGRGRVCHLRATHRVTYYQDKDRERTEHACQAHVGIVLDWAAKSRVWARRDGIELPEPTIVELGFTADPHAASYGRTRFLRSEQVVTDGIPQVLIATQSRIPPPPPPRHRTSDRPEPSPGPQPVQETLF
jgi:hypothetical protein